MTAWDLRALVRAFGAALVGLAVVWLVTAASDEGLTSGARAGRTLPVAPLCSAVAAALALGTARVRGEIATFEMLGRSPEHSARGAVAGAALPSIVLALAILVIPHIDVAGFYPRPPRGDAFVRDAGSFVSTTLGVRVADDGTITSLESLVPQEPLPSGARLSAALATGMAGIALALVSAHAALRPSLTSRSGRRRRWVTALALMTGCAVLTLVAFQAAAARIAPAALGIAPATALLAFALFSYRSRHERDI